MKGISITVIWMVSSLTVAAQNIGIGIIDATRGKLEVNGTGSPLSSTVALFGSNSPGVSIQRNWPTIGFNQYRDDVTPGVQGKYIANGFAAIQYFDYNTGTYAFDMFPSGAANDFTPSGVRAITIAANGNTGIRTSYTNASLVVARGDGVDGTAVFAGTEAWSHINYSTNEDTYIRPGRAGGTVYINKIPNGNVLVGTTVGHIGINNPAANPFYTIEVYQPSGQKAFTLVDVYGYRWGMAANFINTLNNGTGVVLDLYYNNTGRTRFQYWDGQCIVLSDERVKKDIEPMEPVLEKLKRLKPVKYEMIRNNPQHFKSIGLVAQEVKPLFPTLVRQIKDHNFEGEPINNALVMDYSGFGVIAIKALQEQQLQIRALENEKLELLNRLHNLELLMGN